MGFAVKRFIGLLLGIVGAALCLYCGYYILVEPGRGPIWGYHPMYPGLLGLALLTLGVVFHQN